MRWISIPVAAAAGLALSATAALAHAELTGSAPSDGAMVMEAPASLVLSFNEPVRLTAVTLHSAGGEDIRLDVDPRAEADNDFDVALPDLGLGMYSAQWRAVGDDGHALNGEIAFHYMSHESMDMGHMNHETMGGADAAMEHAAMGGASKSGDDASHAGGSHDD